MAASSSALSHQLSLGEKLISEASLVGDLQGFELWRLRKSRWALDTAAALEDVLEAETIARFERAVLTRPGEGTLHEDMPVELEGLRRGLALLAGRAEAPPGSR